MLETLNDGERQMLFELLSKVLIHAGLCRDILDGIERTKIESR